MISHQSLCANRSKVNKITRSCTFLFLLRHKNDKITHGASCLEILWRNLVKFESELNDFLLATLELISTIRWKLSTVFGRRKSQIENFVQFSLLKMKCQKKVISNSFFVCLHKNVFYFYKNFFCNLDKVPILLSPEARTILNAIGPSGGSKGSKVLSCC